jgi:hypothetical protein
MWTWWGKRGLGLGARVGFDRGLDNETFIAMMLLLIASIFLLHGRSRMVMVVATLAALAAIIVTAGWGVPHQQSNCKTDSWKCACRLDKYPTRMASQPLGEDLDRRFGIWLYACQHPADRGLVPSENNQLVKKMMISHLNWQTHFENLY